MLGLKVLMCSELCCWQLPELTARLGLGCRGQQDGGAAPDPRPVQPSGSKGEIAQRGVFLPSWAVPRLSSESCLLVIFTEKGPVCTD